MGYLGNAPARSFISFERQVFTIVNSQTAYTLSHSVTNENDIRLVVNNVVQEPGSGKAYTASGTTLTLSAALTNGTDEMYCVFLGRAVGTVDPPAGSVDTAQLAADAVTGAKIADDAISDEHLDPTAITGQTAETTIADDDLILLSDTSASAALKKMTRANFVSGVGGDNTPAFYGELASTQTIARNTYVKVTGMTNDEVDSDTAFDGTTFTVPSGEGGKYYICGTTQVDFEVAGDDGGEARSIIYKNGSAIKTAKFRNTSTLDLRYVNLNASGIFSLSAGDTIELYTLLNDNSGNEARVSSNNTSIGGYKLIGV